MLTIWKMTIPRKLYYLGYTRCHKTKCKAHRRAYRSPFKIFSSNQSNYFLYLNN